MIPGFQPRSSHTQPPIDSRISVGRQGDREGRLRVCKPPASWEATGKAAGELGARMLGRFYGKAGRPGAVKCARSGTRKKIKDPARQGPRGLRLNSQDASSL
ncbi:hypothetical protein EJB05_09160, partial [Eragrostis curvula]